MKSVRQPGDAKRLLQPASSNRKLGGGKAIITRGRWRGMPMYMLTLEERKTCPKTCQQWASCYGNNMPFAGRLDASAPDFYSLLGSELSSLSSSHSAGFVVRLHVLGDFFSVGYVDFWIDSMKRHPPLRIFGYTHRPRTSRIGRRIAALNTSGAWIRWSDALGPMSANAGPIRDPGDIQCPEQVGKTESCLTCGLCWQTTKPIHFEGH
jgi:hypothetical protein